MPESVQKHTIRFRHTHAAYIYEPVSPQRTFRLESDRREHDTSKRSTSKSSNPSGTTIYVERISPGTMTYVALYQHHPACFEVATWGAARRFNELSAENHGTF